MPSLPLVVSKLSASYIKGVIVLDDVNMEVKDREIRGE